MDADENNWFQFKFTVVVNGIRKGLVVMPIIL